MKRIAQKIKGIVAAKGIGIFRGAARVAGARPRSVFLTSDGSWGWPLRILILCVAFAIAALIALYFADDIIRPLLEHHRRRTLSNAEYGEIIEHYQILLSTVTAGLFSVTFGLGYWVIRNHDVKQAARVRFRQANKESFSSAIYSLSEKGVSDAKVRNAHGLRELAALLHEGAIEEEKIHAMTRVGHDLRGINLEKAALAGLDLKGVQLSDAILEGADLSRANLLRAKLTGADLSRVDLASSCLVDADLSEAQLIEANLIEANLTGARLNGADLSGADLTDADLNGADLRRADLRKADFPASQLVEADLRGTDLRGADLRGADLSGADLRGADLSGVDARGALCDENTEFPKGFDPEKRGLKSL